MQIDINLLLVWGAASTRFRKGEAIFNEGEKAHFYYQIQEGEVKMVNINNEGKEFVQEVFTTGNGFGEPALFLDEAYPVSAVAATNSIILKISKDKLLKMMDESPCIQKDLIKVFCQRIYNKTITLREIVGDSPEELILAFLDSMKKRSGLGTTKQLVDFTRQEIANFTGLRVETVIRTLKNLEKTGKVEIIHHKLWY
jgi:CRP/FNR family transcriptional regulator